MREELSRLEDTSFDIICRLFGDIQFWLDLYMACDWKLDGKYGIGS
jgi:hypothetical protein